MLRILNQYCHGYVLVPVATALEHGGVFERLQHGPVSEAELCEAVGANSGPLHFALELCHVLGWTKARGGLLHLEPSWTPDMLPPPGMTALYRHSPVDLVTSPEGVQVLTPWLERVAQGWETESPLSLLFDGPPMLSLLIATTQLKAVDALLHQDRSTLPAVEAMRSVLLAKKWAVCSEDGFKLNGVGKFMFGRCMIGGVTVSYRPMLERMDQLLFGDVRAALAVNGTTEGHIDRTLNVQSSGFQHEKYFTDLSGMLIASFDENAEVAAPECIADMGCGDGTLLRSLYERILEQTKSVPTLIGADYNHKALDAAKKTLHQTPNLLLHGDIGRPDKYSRDIQALKTDADPETILHVRSFLDHNRPFMPIENVQAAESRERLHLPDAGMDSDGELISPGQLYQNLVEHLGRWADILPGQGLLCLEVHSMSPASKAKNFDIAEGFHFDALHALSGQYLCRAHVFVAALAEVGLFPHGIIRRHPNNMPYARITLGCYRRKAFRIRFAEPQDLSSLLSLNPAAELDEMATLMSTSPTTCFVLTDEAAVIEGGIFLGPDMDETADLQIAALVSTSSVHAEALLEHVSIYCSMFDSKLAITGTIEPSLAAFCTSLDSPHCMFRLSASS